MTALMRSLLVAGSMLAGSMLLPLPANADEVSIKSLNFNGSGCHKDVDAWGEIFDPDEDGFPDQFQILFSNYIAELGPDVAASQRRKNCNITVVLHLPQGFQFSIATAQYEGFAFLQHGVSGQQRTDYSFPLFATGTATAQTILRGFYESKYTRLDTLGIASLVWSPCGLETPLSIRTQVRVWGPSHKEGFMTVDQTDLRVTQIYGLTWRPCRPHRR